MGARDIRNRVGKQKKPGYNTKQKDSGPILGSRKGYQEVKFIGFQCGLVKILKTRLELCHHKKNVMVAF